MQAEVREIGERPKTWTPARQNTPQAAVMLARLFEQPGHDWADKADVVIDWQNELLESSEEELHYPVLLIAVSKYVPGKGHLVVQTRWNIDNVFTGDFVSHEILLDAVEDLRIATMTKLQEAGVY